MMNQKDFSPESNNASQNQDQQAKHFNINTILNALNNEEELSLEQVQKQIKRLETSLKQSTRDLSKLKKQIQLRPTTSVLMQNTILVTTSIHSDPNMTKLINIKQEDLSNQEQQQEDIDPFKQFKRASLQLGKKISIVNQGLPVLLNLIKSLEKQKNKQILQLRLSLQQKTQSIQQQLNTLKIEQISERLTLTQNLEAYNNETQQKLRQYQTKVTWDIKDMRSKLHQKVSKDTFDNSVQRVTQQNQRTIRKFQEESQSLVNPQKIKQLYQIIRNNKQSAIKDLVQYNLNIQNINLKIEKELVHTDFYKKQRLTLQKRIATTNLNFQQYYAKVAQLVQHQQGNLKRLQFLQVQSRQKTVQVAQMKKVLSSLNISQQFQQMLSKIDPYQILGFQLKIQSLDAQNHSLHKSLSLIRSQMEKMQQKFQISGVLVPNKSRQKEYHLDDLRQIIDQYFKDNRLAHKINKLQAELNDGKANVETVKVLQKRVARMQKENQFPKLIEQFRVVQQTVKRDFKKLEGKVKHLVSMNEVSRAYFEGLASNTTESNPNCNLENQRLNLSRRKFLINQSTNKKTTYATQKLLSRHSNSLRKIIYVENMNSQSKPTFFKNTVSSAKKNILTSNNFLASK